METSVGDFFINQNKSEEHDEDLGDIIEMAKGIARCSSLCVEGHRWIKKAIKPLSQMERDVLVMSFQGLTQVEIAEQVHYSVETVKHIKRQLFERFEVKNISQAVNYATNYHLL